MTRTVGREVSGNDHFAVGGVRLLHDLRRQLLPTPTLPATG
jgi:hypothetical protein